jgi:hypothetical protein
MARRRDGIRQVTRLCEPDSLRRAETAQPHSWTVPASMAKPRLSNDWRRAWLADRAPARAAEREKSPGLSIDDAAASVKNLSPYPAIVTLKPRHGVTSAIRALVGKRPSICREAVE